MLTQAQIQTVYKQSPEAICSLVLTLQMQIDALTAQVKELQNRLDKDSHNISKPPTSDHLGKKPFSLCAPSGRKPGGQKGHAGRTLTLVDNPDAVVVHTPAVCGGCGLPLDGVQGHDTARRQVVDLPPLSLVTAQH